MGTPGQEGVHDAKPRALVQTAAGFTAVGSMDIKKELLSLMNKRFYIYLNIKMSVYKRNKLLFLIICLAAAIPAQAGIQ